MWRARPPHHVAADVLPLIRPPIVMMPATAPDWYFTQYYDHIHIFHSFYTFFKVLSLFVSLCPPPSLSQKPRLSRHLSVEAVPMGPPAPPPQSCGPSRSLRAPDPFIEKLHAVDKELELSPLCMEPYQVLHHIHTKNLSAYYIWFSLNLVCLSVEGSEQWQWRGAEWQSGSLPYSVKASTEGRPSGSAGGRAPCTRHHTRYVR